MTRDGGSRPYHFGPGDFGATYEPFVSNVDCVSFLTLELPVVRGGATGLEDFLCGVNFFPCPTTVEGGE